MSIKSNRDNIPRKYRKKCECFWNFDCEEQIKFNWEDVSSGTNIQKSKQDLTTGSPGG